MGQVKGYFPAFGSNLGANPAEWDVTKESGMCRNYNSNAWFVSLKKGELCL